jgi:hypothetical protein
MAAIHSSIGQICRYSEQKVRPQHSRKSTMHSQEQAGTLGLTGDHNYILVRLYYYSGIMHALRDVRTFCWYSQA